MGVARHPAALDELSARLSGSEHEVLADVERRVARAIGEPFQEMPPSAVRDLVDARRALRNMWDRAVSALVTAPAVDFRTPAGRARLADALTAIREADATFAERAVRGRHRLALRGIRESVAALHSVRTVAALFETAADVSNTYLGFDRTLVSQVADSTWKLHTMRVPRAPSWADDIVQAGKASPPPLDGTIVESDVATSATPGLVFEAQDNPRVYRPLSIVGRSESYAVAPVVVDGEVVAFVHSDRFFQGRTVTPDDRAILAVLAEGVAHRLNHLQAMAGIAALRSGVSVLSSAFAGVDERPRDQVAPSPVTAAPAHRRRSQVQDLTRRETEVLDLLATGAANGTIARRLVISEATVKTHVTSILRKLGATNRAEAVAVWLRPA